MACSRQPHRLHHHHEAFGLIISPLLSLERNVCASFAEAATQAMVSARKEIQVRKTRRWLVLAAVLLAGFGSATPARADRALGRSSFDRSAREENQWLVRRFDQFTQVSPVLHGKLLLSNLFSFPIKRLVRTQTRRMPVLPSRPDVTVDSAAPDTIRLCLVSSAHDPSHPRKGWSNL